MKLICLCPVPFSSRQPLKPRACQPWRPGVPRRGVGYWDRVVLGRLCEASSFPRRFIPGASRAIHLRYRHADEMSNERTRFSLGIKYIVTLGVQYKSVEEAGSEGIKNLATTWYNKFKKYNTASAQTKAYVQGVPQVALLHQ